MFPKCCWDAPENHHTVWYKLKGGIFEDLYFVAIDGHLHLTGAVSVIPIFWKNKKPDVKNSVFIQAI